MNTIHSVGNGISHGFIAFHHDYREGGRGALRPEEEVRLGIMEICECMTTVLNHPDNFLGLVDGFGKTLQFVVEDDLTITAELVLEDRGGSMSVNMPLSDAIQLAAEAPLAFTTLNIPNAVFRRW